MIRNLKVLGLAAAAVLAMSAVVASVASAQTVGKLTSDGPVTLDMTEIAGKANAFTMITGETECPGSTVTGHKVVTVKGTEEGKTHELIPSNASSITITPHFINCKWNVANPKTTVTMNGCDFEFHIGETVSANQYSLTADTVCPPGKHIQWERYAFPNTELGGLQCTFTFKPQSGLTGPVLTTDTVNDDLRIEGVLGQMQYEETGSGAGCVSGAVGGLEWDINMTVEGTSAVGAKTGITVTH